MNRNMPSKYKYIDFQPSLSTIASASAATEKTLVPSRPNSTISNSNTLVESEAESTLRGQPSFESDIESSKTILGHNDTFEDENSSRTILGHNDTLNETITDVDELSFDH